MKYCLLLICIITCISCGSLTKNSWQNNPCTFSDNKDKCEHDRYLKSIKR